jgi:hypothetical protein
MALSNDFNTATPGYQDDPRFADDEMRLIKSAVQERMNDHNGTANEGDHYWPLTTTQVSDVNTGQHRMLTLRQMTDNPGELDSYVTKTDLGFIFQKNVGSNGELFWQDEAGQVTQITTGGKINLAGGAILDGLLHTGTSVAGDSKSITLASGGAMGVGRGATLAIYGNEHATLPGQVVLEAGYSTGTTKAIIDAKTSKISNVADPAAAQDAVTKAYLESKIGTGAIAPIPMAGASDSTGECTFSNGLVLKWGKKSLTSLQEVAVDFTDEGLTDFSAACFQAFICYGTAGTAEFAGAVSSLGTSSITIKNGSDETRIVRWFAIGH